MKFKSFQKYKLLAVVICMLAAGICYSCSRCFSQQEEAVIPLGEAIAGSGLSEGAENEKTDTGQSSLEAKRDDSAGQSDPGQGTSYTEDDVSKQEKSQEVSLIYVHVCGLVEKPGVYALPEGSRVYEAIEAAGGFAEDGAQDFLNLAQETEDGMKLEVPSMSQAEQWRDQGLTSVGVEMPAGSEGKGAKVLVNLNTATKEELMALKGIGESRAEDIIKYRETYGSFQAIEDVMNVSGIKEGAFEKMKDSITV